MNGIFKQGRNCWRIERADYVSIVVDYGNYYRDLRESIIKAEKSIFILGWDIDSRIKLLRGRHAENQDAPTVFFDLICWKAKNNPDLQIYLNKWDYSTFFMRQREPFWNHKWESCGLPNLHFCMDDVLPLGGCHHQKVAVIDDEIAYWGGMDVALGRWDFRQHHVENINRADPGQLPHPGREEHFGPYHDIQAVLAGPAATALAELVRTRWNIAVRHETPVPLQPKLDTSLPKTWPDSDPPDFKNVTVAIARTLPALGKLSQTEEVYHLLLDEIATAENFIYIENQFLASSDIARALNKRLRERPDLRILAISCFNPQGMMEARAMWGKRVVFRDLLEENGMKDRSVLAYPACKELGHEEPVRIHSKLMIIDDKLLHIGSANINNRSMGMDTECDVVLMGEDKVSRAKIASVRNDLIREHSGFEIEVINDIVMNGKPVTDFLIDRPTSRQHLRRIDDEHYRHQSFMRIATWIADPRKPFIPTHFTRFPRHSKAGPLKGRTVWVGFAVLLALFALSLLWSHTPLAEYADKERISAMLEQVRHSPVSLFWVILIYVIGGLCFFPVTVLSGAVILVFGGIKGFIFSMIGAVISGLVGYAIGHWIGKEKLQNMIPKSRKVVNKVKESGVVGVAVIRTLPIAPFSLMNMVFGVVGVGIPAFVLGTMLGLAPGKIMLAIFGDSIMHVFENPEPRNILFAVLGLAGWLVVVLLCNKLAKLWQARHKGGS